MKKPSKESSGWLFPTTLVPIILAIISLIGSILNTILNRETATELQLSRQEFSLITRDLGFAMNENKRYKRARTLLEIALRHSPNDGDIHSSLGYSHLCIGLEESGVNRLKAKIHFEEAVKHYEEALKLEGEIAAAANQSNLGRAFLELAKLDEAEDNLLQAQKVYYQNWDLMAQLGRLYLLKNDHQNAIKWLNDARTLWAQSNPGQRNEYLDNLIVQAQELAGAAHK